jgi:hypothetical protein
MRFPKSLHAEGWHTHLHQLRMASHDDDLRSSRERRGFHVLAAVVAVGSLLASAGLNAVDDPRPLDVQLSTAMHNAGETLRAWQGQLSRGLQVSLRAVADGKELPAAATAASTTQATLVVAAATSAVDADDRDQPVSAEATPLADGVMR